MPTLVVRGHDHSPFPHDAPDGVYRSLTVNGGTVYAIMSVKIPSSLKWLVSHHAHLAGEIDRLKKRLRELPDLIDALDEAHRRRVKNYEARRAALERSSVSTRRNLLGCDAALAALEQSIQLHQIPVEVSSIPVVKV